MLPLLMIMFASVLGIARAMGYVDFTGDPLGNQFYNGSGVEYDANGTLIVNGSSSQMTTETASVGLTGVVSSGVISLVVTSVALAVVSGIQIVGSGLSDTAVQAIFKSASYFGIWALFSVMALLLFAEVPVFGYPLYFLLTFFYAVGVVGQIGN